MISRSTVQIFRNPLLTIPRLSCDERSAIRTIIMSLNRHTIKLPKDIWNYIIDMVLPIENMDIIRFIDKMMDNNDIFVTSIDIMSINRPNIRPRDVSYVSKNINPILKYPRYARVYMSPFGNPTEAQKEQYQQCKELINHHQYYTKDGIHWQIHPKKTDDLPDIFIGYIIDISNSATIIDIKYKMSSSTITDELVEDHSYDLCASDGTTVVHSDGLGRKCHTVGFPIIMVGMWDDVVSAHITFSQAVTIDDFEVQIVGCYLCRDNRRTIAQFGYGPCVNDEFPSYKGFHCRGGSYYRSN